MINPGDWPSGSGELASLIRQFNWSQTSLGPISAWPQFVRTIVDTIVASPVAIATLWHEDAVMIYNDAFSEVAGKRHPRILGSQTLESWPEVADFNRHVLDTVLAGGTLTFVDQELTLLRNNVPEQVWLNLYYSPIVNEKGQPRGVFAIVVETTQLILAERNRKQAEQHLLDSHAALQQANSELEQFAFSASHDLQEPVRMVSIYSELLRRKLEGSIAGDAALLLQNCTNGAQRLDHLLKDLLEYTQIATVDPKQPAAVVFADVLANVTQNLEVGIREAEAVITHDDFPSLHMHRVHLYQILQNLLSNAIKYRSSAPLRVHIGVSGAGSDCVFCVKDNGIGIQDAYQKQIFGLFKRLHTNSVYEGTGLGLAICKKLTERYNGRIWVESQPGVGSAFYFTLPAAII